MFRQTVLAAMQAAIAEGPPDEVGEQARAHGGHPKRASGVQQAKALLVNAFWRMSPGGQRHHEVLDNVTAVRKAATAVVACVAGVMVGELSLELEDEAWLQEPTPWSEKTDPFTTRYWACCSAWVGIRLAQDVVSDDDGDITDYDVDLYDGPGRAFSRLKKSLEGSCDVDNLCDYAMKLAGWAEKTQGFEVLTDALLTERSLSAQEVEELLAGNGVVAASLRFHYRLWPHADVGLKDAPELPANAPSTVVYISQVRQAFDDDFLQASGVPIQC